MKNLAIYFTSILYICILLVSCNNKPQQYSIAITNDGNGSVQAYPAAAEQGSAVAIFATPNEWCHFVRWNVVSGNVELEDEAANPLEFTMPAGDVEIMAEFTFVTSLAESIQFWDYSMDVEGSFGGVTLRNSLSECTITSISDDEVFMYFSFGGIQSQPVDIEIPLVPLSGKPYNVTFDHRSSGVKLRYLPGEIYRYSPADTHIKGWIKKKEGETWLDGRLITDIVYECDIMIICDVDGKELKVKITQLNPWQYYNLSDYGGYY